MHPTPLQSCQSGHDIFNPDLRYGWDFCYCGRRNAFSAAEQLLAQTSPKGIFCLMELNS